ncbi:MAG: hypothetical protein ACI84C_002497 [Flavobacteriales bacterium]|jgi:hypothetical protein
MMRPLIFLCLIFLAHSTVAQYEPPDETLPETRNTLGTNLTPIAIFLMNGFHSTPRYTLHYKRQNKINRKIRFSVNYEIRERYQEDLEDAAVIAAGDSTVVFKLGRKDDYIFDVRGGMEWFKPNRNFSMVYGLDLYLGYRSVSEGFDTETIRMTDIGFIPANADEDTFEHNTEYAMIGIDFSIGPRLTATEKVNFVLRWTPQFGYITPISENYSDPIRRTDPATSGFDYHLRLIEVYVNYLF